MIDPTWIANFKVKLDQHYAWPSLYTFKFVVKKNQQQELIAMFPNHSAILKESKKGNYTSITFTMMMPTSDAVLHVYQTASQIEGIIAL